MGESAQFKIERRKLKIEIYGKVYDITKPKFKQMTELQDKLESLSAKEKFDAIKENLVASGLPEEVMNDMDADSVIELLEIVNGTKKN